MMESRCAPIRSMREERLQPKRSAFRCKEHFTDLLGPADPAYANARVISNSMVARSPGLIVRRADVADVQAMMRHSHISTTHDIYKQFVPDSQRRAIQQTSKMAAGRIANAQAARAIAASSMLN
jgi:hypothetical protein